MGFVRLRNPFAYPGGKPGFDPAHPAAGSTVRVSAVAAGNGFVNLLTGKKATVTGTASYPNYSIGPVMVTTSAASGYATFPTPNELTTSIVMGCVYLPTASNSVTLLCGQASQCYLEVLSLTLCAVISGVGTQTLTTLTVGVPYFIGFSWAGGSDRTVVVTNLQTGSTFVVYNKGGIFPISTSGPTFLFAGGGTTGSSLNGGLAAVMYSVNTPVSKSRMLAWAADPWAFWYPQTTYTLAPTTEITNVNPPVMGSGGGRGARALSLRNPFAYPGTKPGFNPAHVAVTTRKIASLIPSSGGAFVNLVNGVSTTLYGAPAYINTPVGPAIRGNSGTNFFYPNLTFSGNNNFTAVTAAVIYTPTLTLAGAPVLTSTGNSSGSQLTIFVTNLQIVMYSGDVGTFKRTPWVYSGIMLTLGVPYFIAVSSTIGANVKLNIVVTELTTGKIQTFSTFFTLGQQGGAYWGVGGSSGAGCCGNVSSAMISFAALNMPQLVEWAADPWAFWYPPTNAGDRILQSIRVAGPLTLPADAGAYTILGTPPTPSIARIMPVIEGSYTVLGGAAAGARGASSLPGFHTLSGQPQALTSVRSFAAAKGVYALIGKALTPSAARMIVVPPGIYGIAGKTTASGLNKTVSGVAAASGAGAVSAVLTVSISGADSVAGASPVSLAWSHMLSIGGVASVTALGAIGISNRFAIAGAVSASAAGQAQPSTALAAAGAASASAAGPVEPMLGIAVVGAPSTTAVAALVGYVTEIIEGLAPGRLLAPLRARIRMAVSVSRLRTVGLDKLRRRMLAPNN